MKIIRISETEFLLERGNEVLLISTTERVTGGYYGSSLIPANGVVPTERWTELVSGGAKVEELESDPILLDLFNEIHNAEVDEEMLTLQDEFFAYASEHYGCTHDIPEKFKVLCG